MAIIATDVPRYSGLVKHEYMPEIGYCKKMVVVNGAAATIAIGTVLGQVTATGKYKVVEATATDGSQVAAAVVVGNARGHALPTTMAATTDTNFLVLHRGPAGVAAGALVYGASVNTDTLKATAAAQLAAVGIDALVTI